MGENKRSLGTRYENAAAEYLQERGYRILTRNFRIRQSEIDLIALDQDTLVFIEVKYRRDPAMGYGSEAVDSKKQQRIIRCARYYLLTHPEYETYPCRFDVCSICGTEFILYQDAFWA